jgi:DNA-binding NtrC family response regulator
MAAQPVPATHLARLLWLRADSGRFPLGDAAAVHSSVDWTGNVFEALAALRTGDYPVVIASLPVEGWEAGELVGRLLEAKADAQVILHDPSMPDGEIAKLVRLGAFDIWREEITAAGAIERVRGLLSAAPRRREEAAWRKTLVGESAPVRQILDVIGLVAGRRCTVLITGETGTGKEMAARAIHLASPRARFPMVAVNCSALPENLLEAELFGHVRGAFTGAVQSRVGRFEQAHRGTLFLDEIGDLPLELQAKLLRVLQERELQRLGSSETVKVDVRVVAATNADLAAMVREGRFREDLYYRINVVPLAMPPLRERGRDIEILARHFVEKICRMEEIPVKRIAPETLDRLRRYNWPGNVRQLENAVETAVALSGTRESLMPGDFALPLPQRRPAAEAPAFIAVPDEGLDFEATVGRIELGILEQALKKTKGNKKMAAELLRLKRTTLTAKLKTLEAQSQAWTA